MREQPVKENQILEVEIEGQGQKGDGVAKEQGFAIFVPSAKPGETHMVKITKVMDKFAFAKIIPPTEDTEDFGE